MLLQCYPEEARILPIARSHVADFFGGVKPVLVRKHRNRSFPQLSLKGKVTGKYKSQQWLRNEPVHYSLPAIPAVVVTEVFADRKPASPPGHQRYPDLDSAVRSTLSGSWHAMNSCLGLRKLAVEQGSRLSLSDFDFDAMLTNYTFLHAVRRVNTIHFSSIQRLLCPYWVNISN
jgi:hypothetical protein